MINMDAKDLMIGDHLIYISGEHCIVSEISAKGLIATSFIDAKGKKQYSTLLPERDFEPIPLTAEILEKNGFSPCEMHNGEYEYISDSNLIQVARCKSEYCWYVSIEHVILCLKIKYVHELQHALRLAGVEKEIKL